MTHKQKEMCEGRGMSIKKEIEKEIAKKNHISESAKRQVDLAPEGSLIINSSKGKNGQWYRSRDGKPLEYIKKSEIDLAKSLAQKRYNNKLIKTIDKQIKAYEKCLEICDDRIIIDIYENNSNIRKTLIEPCILPDKDYIEKWKNSFKNHKNPFPIEIGYTTENGELVRSKSEKIMADKLLYENIPYVYEPMLTLNSGVIYPDFAILDLKERKTIYHEHFGMMDDEEYLTNSFFKKLEKYADNNMTLGIDWIATFESKERPFDINQFARLIEKHFIKC